MQSKSKPPPSQTRNCERPLGATAGKAGKGAFSRNRSSTLASPGDRGRRVLVAPRGRVVQASNGRSIVLISRKLAAMLVAARSANALMVLVGLTAAPLGIELPSTMKRFGTSKL